MKDCYIRFMEATISPGQDLVLPLAHEDQRVQVLDVKQIGPDLHYKLVVIRGG